VPRPRHSLKGRQCGEEVDRISLRLAFRKAQAAVGDIVLLFADESEALTHPCPARAWARRGTDLRVSAPGQARKVAMMGALDWRDRRLIVATSKTRRSADFAAFLENLDHPCGPKPGQPRNPVVIVQGNGPIHTGKATRAAPAARAHWPSVGWLPEYAPELNDIETVWRDLKAHHLAHQTFTDTDNLDRTIHEAVEALNVERKPNPLANQRISALGSAQSEQQRPQAVRGAVPGQETPKLVEVEKQQAGCRLDRGKSVGEWALVFTLIQVRQAISGRKDPDLPQGSRCPGQNQHAGVATPEWTAPGRCAALRDGRNDLAALGRQGVPYMQPYRSGRRRSPENERLLIENGPDAICLGEFEPILQCLRHRAARLDRMADVRR